jgi:hypothetical protein
MQITPTLPMQIAPTLPMQVEELPVYSLTNPNQPIVAPPPSTQRLPSYQTLERIAPNPTRGLPKINRPPPQTIPSSVLGKRSNEFTLTVGKKYRKTDKNTPLSIAPLITVTDVDAQKAVLPVKTILGKRKGNRRHIRKIKYVKTNDIESILGKRPGSLAHEPATKRRKIGEDNYLLVY